MLRLLGLLSLGHLLFGGRHHRRALRGGLLFGVLLGWLADRDFDPDRARKDVRKAARKARKAAHEAVRAARKEFRGARRAARGELFAERVAMSHAGQILSAIHDEAQAWETEREGVQAEREERNAEAVRTVRALPECDTREAKEIRELAEDLERDARTAAMAAEVPVIEFPEEDEKYLASRKYGYA